MLQTIEVSELVSKAQAAADVETGRHSMASMRVMYHRWPEDGAPFIMVRQWGTLDGRHGEIVAEWGHVDGEGELQTEAAVLPYWYDLELALEYVNEQLAEWVEIPF